MIQEHKLAHLQYFMNLSLFKKSLLRSNVVFSLSENYEKRSFCNRCEVIGANGRILLSVPLKKGRNQRVEFRDVQIANDEKWQLRHWRSIQSSYNGSPWFYHFRDEMADLYSRPFSFLYDWNLACTTWIFEKFQLRPQTRLIGPVVEIQLTPPTTSEAQTVSGIQTEKEDTVVYRQVFQEKLGFIPNVSIIDLLFCEGPKKALTLLM